jgi:hypothetical protein
MICTVFHETLYNSLIFPIGVVNMPFREGDIVAGEFRIEEQVGVGEARRVYRALGDGSQGWVAVKELRDYPMGKIDRRISHDLLAERLC